jgi:hypothetical protein
LEKRIRDLEQLIGKKEVEIALLKKTYASRDPRAGEVKRMNLAFG